MQQETGPAYYLDRSLVPVHHGTMLGRLRGVTTIIFRKSDWPFTTSWQ
ncbi:MAG TPA: hypothetical protein VGR19_02690 [Allosphingosinicella sp.]|nr:hypothetical protein [Allosphingosinicella sp.]